MARFDAAGLFWEDKVIVKVKKEKIVRVPPKPVWLEPDYLPDLAEAMAFRPDLFTDQELVAASLRQEILVWDTECYPNYWCACFKSIQSGKSIIFEMTDDGRLSFDYRKLRWVLENFLLVDFNGEGYDKWTGQYAAKGATTNQLYIMTQRIIEWQEQGYQVAKNMSAKIKGFRFDHIDVFQLTPLHPGLKTMAGRLDAPLMMDLPFVPGTLLSEPQIVITRWYCFNDLGNTLITYNAHKKNIELREKFGPRYKVDLRSDSDAQMAEAIFRAEVKNRTGQYVAKTVINPGHSFKFQTPKFINFKTANLQWLLATVQQCDFVINENGYVTTPPQLEGMVIPIGDMTFKFGLGGLHSQEKRSGHVAGDKWILRDFDVASYYPKSMIASGLAPPAIGPIFQQIFPGIVAERLKAKVAGDTTAANGLKIVVNGTFGKTMDPWSCLYFPEFGMQTTLTGQLALLMAIERLVLAGIRVINANTDGIVVKARVDQEPLLMAIFKQWELETSLEMETTDYTMLFSRDVNNYIAFYKKPKKGDNGELEYAKAKGVFGERGIKKNSVTEICSQAALAYIRQGIPIEQTVMECKNPAEFMAMRAAAGGGVKVYPDRTEFLGKVVRWYYAHGIEGEIVTAKKGHVVGDTQGAKPCMRMPVELPDDINHQWYIDRAYKFLDQMGYTDLIELGEVPPMTTRSITT